MIGLYLVFAGLGILGVVAFLGRWVLGVVGFPERWDPKREGDEGLEPVEGESGWMKWSP